MFTDSVGSSQVSFSEPVLRRVESQKGKSSSAPVLTVTPSSSPRSLEDRLQSEKLSKDVVLKLLKDELVSEFFKKDSKVVDMDIHINALTEDVYESFKNEFLKSSKGISSIVTPLKTHLVKMKSQENSDTKITTRIETILSDTDNIRMLMLRVRMAKKSESWEELSKIIGGDIVYDRNDMFFLEESISFVKESMELALRYEIALSEERKVWMKEEYPHFLKRLKKFSLVWNEDKSKPTLSLLPCEQVQRSLISEDIVRGNMLQIDGKDILTEIQAGQDGIKRMPSKAYLIKLAQELQNFFNFQSKYTVEKQIEKYTSAKKDGLKKLFKEAPLLRIFSALTVNAFQTPNLEVFRVALPELHCSLQGDIKDGYQSITDKDFATFFTVYRDEESQLPVIEQLKQFNIRRPSDHTFVGSYTYKTTLTLVDSHWNVRINIPVLRLNKDVSLDECKKITSYFEKHFDK